MWLIVYIALVATNYTDLGMMTTGPFQSEEQCLEFAYSNWKGKDGWKEDPDQPHRYNWFSSYHTIHFMDNAEGNIGIYFSCIKNRSPNWPDSE